MFERASETPYYTVLPALLVHVATGTTTVTVPSEVNCAKGGQSDPVVVSTTLAPYTAAGKTGGLTVTLGAKAKAKDAKEEPSAGVTGYGKPVSFDVGRLSGFVYLTCDAKMAKTATITVTLGGTAMKAYTCNKEMTVKPVDKAKALTGDAAKVGPTKLSAGGSAGVNHVDIKCPVTGTAWV